MSTTYQFSGTIKREHILLMHEKINQISQRKISRNLIEITHIDQYPDSIVLTAHCDFLGANRNSLVIDFEDDCVTFITAHAGNSCGHLIALIEYFSNVKIWDEYTLLDLKIWLEEI